MKTLRFAPLALCLCIGQALAGTPISLRHAASADARIKVSNIAGTVTVTAWDRNEVQVSGQLGAGAEPLAITGNDNDLAIQVKSKGSSSWFNWGSNNRMEPTTLELHVPKAAALDVSVISAPLLIDGMDGGVIEVNTVSGKARINARTPSLKVDSVSGGIELAGHAASVDLQTVSGEILAPALGEEASLQTVSGEIQAQGGPWRKLSLSTVSGDVQLSGGLASDGKISIDSMSGDVQLQLPTNTAGKLHASSFSGDLRSDFGSVQEPEHGPGSSLDAQLGSGGSASIKIETFSGDLRVRKQP